MGPGPSGAGGTAGPPGGGDRVMGLFMLGVMGLAPLSMAAGGLVGSVLGPRALLAGGGLVVAAAGAFALSRRPFREAARAASPPGALVIWRITESARSGLPGEW